MHEAFITRGDIQGHEHMASRIMVEENCALVHTGQCHIESATKGGQRKVAKHIIYWMGESSVLEWLDCLADDFVGTTITEARNLVTEVIGE